MFCVSITPVHGHHSMSHGYYKPHSFLQLSSQSMVVIEGTLMECEFLPFPKDDHTLFHNSVVSQEMFKILCFMGGNPLHHNFEYRIFLCSYPVYYTHVYMCVGGPDLDCCFLNLFMYPFVSLCHHWVMGISPSYGSYGDAFHEGLHSFCIQLWCNTAQSIYNSIVSSLLIFNAKYGSCQWLHPMMPGGI